MPDLDFTALKKIAYQGFKTEQDKDSLIDQGFTILQGEKTPFDAPEPPAVPQRSTTAPDALIGTKSRAQSEPLKTPPPSPEPPKGSPAPRQPSPDLIAWRAVYRLFCRYSPAIKAATSTDAIADTFLQICGDPDYLTMTTGGGDSLTIASGLYAMLEELSRKRAADLQRDQDTPS